VRILLVEDDPLLADAVARAFEQNAHAVDVARTGEAADQALVTATYDLVLLDIALPKMNGLDVLRRLKARRSAVPVILITVRDSLEDRVDGLDCGADDYITKPFHLSELEARVRAVMRRTQAGVSSDIVHGRLRLDTTGRRLFADNEPLDLSMREFAVAELLLTRAGKVVTKQQILEKLYGWEEASSSNAVEVFIYRLRKKLESAGVNIRTIRGMGYLIEKVRAD
jgi:two-component system, OmpR family, response regulator